MNVNNVNVLLGGACADSLGKSFEGARSNNQALIAWDGKTFLPGGYDNLSAFSYTDDTCLSLALARSLVENKGYIPEYTAQKYIEALKEPNRSWGGSIKQAVKNLSEGVHFSESGVIGSIGNGTAMRIAPMAVWYRHDLKSLMEFTKIDSNMTHRSIEAEAGALALALAGYFIINDDEEHLVKKISENLPDSKIKEKILKLPDMVCSGKSMAECLRIIGTGMDVRQTVPAALYCYMKASSYEEAIVAAIKAGGDTDTTGSCAGALWGAKVGLKGIPFYYHEVENFYHIVELDRKLYLKE